MQMCIYKHKDYWLDDSHRPSGAKSLVKLKMTSLNRFKFYHCYFYLKGSVREIMAWDFSGSMIKVEVNKMYNI